MTFYVYIMAKADGSRKIGVSKDPWTRRSVVQTGAAGSLKLEAAFLAGAKEIAYGAERRAHELLSGKSIGGEWFRTTMDEAVRTVMFAIDNPLPMEAESERHYRSNAAALVPVAEVCNPLLDWLRSTELSYCKIAKLAGISDRTVSNIVKGKNHISGAVMSKLWPVMVAQKDKSAA